LLLFAVFSLLFKLALSQKAKISAAKIGPPLFYRCQYQREQRRAQGGDAPADRNARRRM